MPLRSPPPTHPTTTERDGADRSPERSKPPSKVHTIAMKRPAATTPPSTPASSRWTGRLRSRNSITDAIPALSSEHRSMTSKP